ncbi:hypothetical protein DLH72_03910 [Candidatus Gracilibacteria bacterium]|nr:MAG: hypothetical protein DLH72_03910 [Candidatus Gracilibacteria bacterium]
MRKKILVSAIILSAFATNTFAADLENIEVLNNGNLSVNTSSDLTLPEGEVSGDLKVLKDYVVSLAYKDPENAKKVLVNLTFALEKNRTYSIIGVDGAETNMNFTVADKVEGEYKNEDKTSTGLKIEKINILDSNSIEIYYNEDLKAEEFVYRILSEIETKSKTGDGKNTMSVSLGSPLEDLTQYIILSNALVDSTGKEVKLKESFYEFATEDKLENVFGDLPKVEEKIEDKKEEGNIEEVAMNSAKTPETGAATWILILATLFITASLVLTRKKA